MRFDRFDSDEPKAASGGEVVPDGDHVCEITADKEWTAQDGSRSATIVSFQPADGFYAFDKFLDPNEERDCKTAQQLLAACGMAPSHDMGKGDLAGHRVIVTTKRAVTRDGEPVLDKRSGLQRVWVNGIKAAPPPKPMWQQNRDEPPTVKSQSTAKRTAHQKAKAAAAEAGIGDDDVPF